MIIAIFAMTAIIILMLVIIGIVTCYRGGTASLGVTRLRLKRRTVLGGTALETRDLSAIFAVLGQHRLRYFSSADQFSFFFCDNRHFWTVTVKSPRPSLPSTISSRRLHVPLLDRPSSSPCNRPLSLEFLWHRPFFFATRHSHGVRIIPSFGSIVRSIGTKIARPPWIGSSAHRARFTSTSSSRSLRPP